MEKIMVTRSSMPEFQEYVDEIRSIWDSRWLTNCGPKHQELERKLTEYLEVPNVSLFTNGHLALETLIDSFEFPVGSEVITTPFTFVSTTLAIIRSGLVPVFCDIKPTDFTMDPACIEKLITKKTVAILPVHVYGNICDVQAIDKIAKDHKLKVIYDAAHAFGEKFNALGVSNYGDASMFSFHATKVFHSIEGGLVVSRDKTIVDRVNILKNFGQTNPENVNLIGGNAKMSEFQAAMGLCNLKHIGDYIEKRSKAVLRYRERLEGIQGLTLSSWNENTTSNYAYFPIVIDPALFGRDRDYVFNQLATKGIFSRKYFYPLTSDFIAIKNRVKGNSALPIATKISERILTLPLFSELTVDVVDYICDSLLECSK